jgi:hypothetical protein
LYSFAEHASYNPTFYADIVDPQSLNKYQYCLNNPLAYVDADGHQITRALERAAQTPAGQKVLLRAAQAGTAVTSVLSGAAEKFWNWASTNNTSGDASQPAASRYVENYVNRKQAENDAQQTQQQQSAEGQSTNYQPNPKHDAPKGDDRRPVSPQPKAGGSLYDSAVQVKPGQRVNVDRSTGGFVVYRTNPNGQTHGYETTWKQLRNDQRAALQKAGLVTQRGKIIPPKEGQQ